MEPIFSDGDILLVEATQEIHIGDIGIFLVNGDCFVKEVGSLELIYDDSIRKVWHKQEEEWYFSIIDVIQVLTDSENPKNYWNMLKSRLKAEGNETYTNCVRLKLKAADGKMRLTDCADTEQLLRIIQSIPSKKRVF